LHWDKPEQEFHAGPADAKAMVVFEFANTGDHPLKILSDQSGCDCTGVELGIDKKAYAPGDKGRVIATFTFGQRVGFQQKTITIVTDDPKQPRAKLILKGTIPEIVTFSTKLLNWEPGEDPKPKTIALSIADGSKAKLRKIEASSDQVQAELKETGPGHYDLVVTPSANAQGTILLKIHCDNPDGGPKTYQAYDRGCRGTPSARRRRHASRPSASAELLGRGYPIRCSRFARRWQPLVHDPAGPCDYRRPLSQTYCGASDRWAFHISL
jgi:hypothetical protein